MITFREWLIEGTLGGYLLVLVFAFVVPLWGWMAYIACKLNSEEKQKGPHDE